MTTRLHRLAGVVAAGLSLTACDAVSKATGVSTPAPVAPAQAAPLTASGAPTSLTAEAADDENIQFAASVVKLEWVADDGAKLFGTAGGDPAMNGLYSYIAFYTSPADGWTIYKLGDFLDYTVLSSSLGRVDLDIHESTMDEASGEIGSRHRKVIVTWTPGTDDGPPTNVAVAPAQ